jgi:hypothetical protein
LQTLGFGGWKVVQTPQPLQIVARDSGYMSLAGNVRATQGPVYSGLWPSTKCEKMAIEKPEGYIGSQSRSRIERKVLFNEKLFGGLGSAPLPPSVD